MSEVLCCIFKTDYRTMGGRKSENDPTKGPTIAPRIHFLLWNPHYRRCVGRADRQTDEWMQEFRAT